MKDKKPAIRSWFELGLRGQQVVMFLLVSLTPLLVVSLTIKVLGGNALKSSVSDGLVLLAREKLYRVDRAISHRIENIRREIPNIYSEVVPSNNAKDDINVLWDVRENLEDSLRLLETYAGGYRRRGYRSIREVTITNAEGYVLRSSNRALDYDNEHQLPTQVSDQNWWDKAFYNGVGFDYAEDVKFDAALSVHFLTVAFPIRSGRSRLRPSPNTENNVAGVIKVVLLLPELSSVVEILPEMEKTYTILTTGSGEIIAVSPESNYDIGQNILTEDAAAEATIQAKKGNEGDYYGYEADGETDRFNESRVYGWARTQRARLRLWKDEHNFTNWIVFVSYPSSKAYAGVAKLNQYVFWVTILSCIIVVPIAYAVAQQISLPVMQLAQTAKRIGQEAKEVVQEESDQIRKQIANMQWYQNEESELISVSSKNEVGILAQEFNEMYRNLKIAVEKLISAEQQMTTIVDCLSEGLIVVDTQDQILYFNPAARHLLNHDETSEFPNRLTELLRATNLTVLADAHGQDTRTTVEVNLDQEGKNRVLRVVTSQFMSISVPVNGNGLPDENADIAGTVYVFNDITREHEIDKMKSDFVALVSHELRTPLTSIIGFITLILDGKTGPLNEVQQQSLTRAHRQSKRLAMMINDLLDISRIEAGRIVMKLEPVDVAEIAKQRLEELKPQADAKTIELNLNVQSDLPDLNGDAEYLGQIFTNLIGNAIKFTPSDGEVKVKVFRKGYPREEDRTGDANENDGIHVEVIDSGPGIPAENQENVFDKFRQLSNIQTREQGGTGLGLSIARGFTEAHKGKIWVDAGENEKGCNFQFWIPFLS